MNICFYKHTAFIVVVTAFICLHAVVPAYAGETIQRISTDELKTLIDTNPKVALINVLPKIIHDDKHIKGSINIPIGVLEKSGLLPAVKTDPVVFYCMGVL